MATDNRKKSSGPRLDEPYLPGDPIPAPDVVEKSSETTWELFKDVEARHNARFEATQAVTRPAQLTDEERQYAKTAPMSLQPDLPTRRRAAPKGPVTVEDVVAEARRNNRVCPMPGHWQLLWEQLPDKMQHRKGWTPQAPMIGPQWNSTSSLAKRMALREHIEWAGSHGCLEQLHGFLKALAEDQWHHMGD